MQKTICFSLELLLFMISGIPFACKFEPSIIEVWSEIILIINEHKNKIAKVFFKNTYRAPLTFE